MKPHAVHDLSQENWRTEPGTQGVFMAAAKRATITEFITPVAMGNVDSSFFFASFFADHDGGKLLTFLNTTVGLRMKDIRSSKRVEMNVASGM